MVESRTDIRDPNELWAIQLLGELRATRGNRTITRFPTQRVGALLAYLAYHLHRPHPGEELIELLWSETEPESGRTSLRTAPASLRRLIEPPDLPSGTVLAANRFTVRLQPEGITTDVAQFEQARKASAAAATPERAPLPRLAAREREQQLVALGEVVFRAAWDGGARLTWERVADSLGSKRGDEEDSPPAG